MSALANKLSGIIEELFEGTTFHLMDIKVTSSKRFSTLRIYIDREDGYLSHSDCENWSRRIQDILDTDELVHGDYRLEVSSPGIGRPLSERWEYEKNLFKALKINYFDFEGVAREIIGTLIEVRDDCVVIEVSKDEPFEIKWENIIKSVIRTPW